MGASDHLAAADDREAQAARHDVVAEEAAQAEVVTQSCGDPALAGPATSGAAPGHPASPCWNDGADVVERHREEAERLRAEAEGHRDRAQELLAVERASCVGMPEDDVTYSPFAHRADIVAVAAVTEERDGEVTRGARIQFRELRGLSAEWMRGAIACQQARAAALGFDAAYLGYDPTTVMGAEVEVIDDPAGIVVIVRSADEAVAATVFGRAAALLDEAADVPPPART